MIHTIPESLNLSDALDQIESMDQVDSFDGGVPVNPLRRTFFPGGSGLDDFGDEIAGGVPVNPLRRTFFPGGSGFDDVEGGVPVNPLRRTFFPGGSGLDDLGYYGPGAHRKFLISNAAGQPVAVVVGKPQQLGSSYSIRILRPNEQINLNYVKSAQVQRNVSQYVPVSQLGSDAHTQSMNRGHVF